jgi:small-conductance mechanosensitive channel
MATKTKDEINRLVFNFYPFNIEQYRNNIERLIDEQKIRSIVAENITQTTWDGEVYIIFSSRATTQEIVNLVISPSKADEISIEYRTLRLWWD